MTRTAFALLAAGLLTPAAAAKSPPGSTPGTAARAAEDGARQRATERTEDVEVLRRILNKALGLPDAVSTRMAPPTSYQAEVTYFLAQTTAAVGPFDGVYLPGHGVVYTLRVPTGVHLQLERPAVVAPGYVAGINCLLCHTGAVNFAATNPDPHRTPPSEWDQTQAALRGAPPPAPVAVTPQKVCEPGNVADVLADKLATHARRVRHIPSGERVTVVITFDGAFGPAATRTAQAHDATQPYSFTDANRRTTGPAGKPGFNPDEVKLLSLGDLHQKQGKHREAVEAYLKALGDRGTTDHHYILTPSPNMTPEQHRQLVAQYTTGVRDVFKQLATAWLAAGEVDKASSALEKARTFQVELASAKPSADRVPVPAKLIVSLPLGQVERADEAAVRKAVTVETVGFPSADPKR